MTWEKYKFTKFPGGGAESLSFQKVFEADLNLTKSTNDLTDGAVDPSQYYALLICYTGTVTNSGNKDVILLSGSSAGNTDDKGDIVVGAGKAGNVDSSLFALRCRCGSWLICRSDNTNKIENSETPLQLYLRSSWLGEISIDVHVTIYGLPRP